MARIGTFARSDSGAALAEYGIILGLISVIGGTVAMNGVGTGTRDRLEAAARVVAGTDPDETHATASETSRCTGRRCEAQDPSRSGGVGSRR